MKSPSSDTDPATYAFGLSQNARYHKALGYSGTLAIVTFADVFGLPGPLTGMPCPEQSVQCNPRHIAAA